MYEDSTLLAYLVPRLTGRMEDAATDALAFILNKSSACRESLSSLLREGEESYGLEILSEFKTQVTYEDGSRPDMLGYDLKGAKRLVAEAKFWASLSEGQASGYFGQLESTGPGVLLFIAPTSRLEILWGEIRRQMETPSSNLRLEKIEIPGRIYKAKASGPKNQDKRLLLISWPMLLDRLATAASDDSPVASDIRQLRGFAQREGEEVFQPIRATDFSPEVPRRMQLFSQLIDEVVDRGCNEDWMSTKGLRATPKREGYGRYFRFKVGNEAIPSDLFLCVDYDLWANRDDAPLWLLIKGDALIDASQLKVNAPTVVDGRDRSWWRYGVPIRLLTGVDRGRVLDDMTDQIKRVWKLASDG